MSGPVIITVSVEMPTDAYTAGFEVPREEWDKMTPAERIKYAEDTASTEFFNSCNYGYTVKE
jgi:hypothetical protein